MGVLRKIFYMKIRHLVAIFIAGGILLILLHIFVLSPMEKDSLVRAAEPYLEHQQLGDDYKLLYERIYVDAECKELEIYRAYGTRIPAAQVCEQVHRKFWSYFTSLKEEGELSFINQESCIPGDFSPFPNTPIVKNLDYSSWVFGRYLRIPEYSFMSWDIHAANYFPNDSDIKFFSGYRIIDALEEPVSRRFSSFYPTRLWIHSHFYLFVESDLLPPKCDGPALHKEQFFTHDIGDKP